MLDLKDSVNERLASEKKKREIAANKKVPITPLHSNVIIKLKELEKETKSGLIIVRNESQEKIQEGHVYALPENPDIKLKVGDRVLFGQHAGTAIEVEEVKYLVLDYEEVIAVIKEKEDAVS